MFLQFYGLREQPFGVTPDPAYLYASRTHCDALDSLSEAILADRGFVALIAEPGMGKTTLLNQVLESLRETARTAFLFQTQCNSREFFQYLMSELGVDASGMGLVAMHTRLNEILFSEMLAGRRCVLIVDEAQNLEPSVLETIRLLSNFETPHCKLLQIILAGQPELGQKLERPELLQLLQRITVWKRLEALSEAETAGYIRHRMRVAGHLGEDMFEPDALALIADRSQGIPRNINKICFHALLEGYAEERARLSAEIVQKVALQLGLGTAARPRLLALRAAAGASAGSATSAGTGTSTTNATPGTTASPGNAPSPGTASSTGIATSTANTRKVTSADTGPAALGVTPVKNSADSDATVPAAEQSASSAPIAGQQLSDQSRARIRNYRWKIFAGLLIAVLVPAGLALPRAVRTKLTQMMHGEMSAKESLTHTVATDRRNEMNGAAPALSGAEGVSYKIAGQGSPNVSAISASSTATDAQVVVTLDDTVRYDSARITSPDRIYFDLYKARLRVSVPLKTVPSEGGLLKWVRVGQNSDDVLRLVIAADGAKDYSAKLLSDPYRLVIDVHSQALETPNGGVNLQTASNNLPAILSNSSAGFAANQINGNQFSANSLSARAGQPSLARELGLKVNRIAIDAGHGGSDTGTTGPRGLLEKNLCLDVALRLGRLIEENIPNAEVIYTRKDDRYVALEERTAIANAANADLFISIHANSSESRATRGVETYYVSLANSRESRELATRENALAESSLHNLPELIKKITGNAKQTESKQLAGNIQSALAQRLQMVSQQETNRGVKQAPFVVLTGANMPAVLTEISFVSNASDESLLLESSQRQRVTEGLYRGVATYLDNMPGRRAKQKTSIEGRAVASAGAGNVKSAGSGL
jgi:N-acetylmuramoyl-L-alanine amidase/type II secretory pathway predicted ATPase ExeA